MKLITAAIISFSLIVITSCKKEFTGSIVGRWNLVKDSSFVAQAPPFFNPGSGSYKGVPGDYYDFRSDGSLYIKEDTYADTLTYEVSSGNQLTFTYRTYNTVADSLGNIISQTHPKKSFEITKLTESGMTFSSNLSTDILTPEGFFCNIVTLAK